MSSVRLAPDPRPRIIAGAWRGRRLRAPAGPATRPTAERLRQAVFDMLAHAGWSRQDLLDGATVLDAFAGTGALGLECLSRGAAQAIFIEQARPALAALTANIAACGAAGRARVIAGDAAAPPPGPACTVAFLDPPYGAGLLLLSVGALTRRGWITPATLIIAEHGAREAPPVEAPLATRTHGAGAVTIWRAAS